MYAFGGMVEWKAVSNTTTSGTDLPNTSMQARMPWTCALLCKGAKGIRLSMPSITLSSTRTDLLNSAPPCTMRWPTAETSSKDLSTPTSGSIKAFFT